MWGHLKARIFDDAGELRDLVSIRQLRWDERQADPAFAEVVHRLSRALTADLVGISLAVSFYTMLLGTFFTSLIFLTNFTPLLSVGLWAFLSYALYRLLRQAELSKVARHTTEVLLTAGLCPSCTYNLAGLPETYGLIECAECGATWQRARIVRFHSFTHHNKDAGIPPLKSWWERVKAFEPNAPESLFDDRSFKRPVVSPRLVWPLRVAEHEHRDRLLEAREEMRAHGRSRRVLIVCALSLVLPLFAAANFRTGEPLSIIWGFFLLGIWVYSWIFTLRGAAGIKAHHIKEAMLRQRLCPSCASDLTTAEQSEVQGFHTCPSCGAIWRLRENAVAQGVPDAAQGVPDKEKRA